MLEGGLNSAMINKSILNASTNMGTSNLKSPIGVQSTSDYQNSSPKRDISIDNGRKTMLDSAANAHERDVMAIKSNHNKLRSFDNTFDYAEP